MMYSCKTPYDPHRFTTCLCIIRKWCVFRIYHSKYARIQFNKQTQIKVLGIWVKEASDRNDDDKRFTNLNNDKLVVLSYNWLLGVEAIK